MSHRAFGLYVHITWHTRLRQRLVRRADADVVRSTLQEAATGWNVHVHEVAILSDHVHIVASFRPEGGVVSFIRHAKSESARRINQARGAVLQ
jgi:REP element-mobilizing transposase RayT